MLPILLARVFNRLSASDSSFSSCFIFSSNCSLDVHSSGSGSFFAYPEEEEEEEASAGIQVFIHTKVLLLFCQGKKKKKNGDERDCTLF
jgi:hypothetical protein